MNRRFNLRTPFVSRILIMAGFVAAVSVAACGEKLEAGAACPILCPTPDVQLLDTTPVSAGSLAADALQETQEGISHVLETARPVELTPQSAYIRRLQHQLAEQYGLVSRSYGKEPNRRVKLFARDE